MSNKIKIRKVVDYLFGVDYGSGDHILPIDKFLDKINKLNKDGYLSKNNGNIFINYEQEIGNWDISVGVDIEREETDEEYKYRMLQKEMYDELDEEYKEYLRLREKFETRYQMENLVGDINESNKHVLGDW